MISTQFTIYLENRPGALARTARVLGDAQINIEGLSAATTADVGLLQVIVNKARKAATVLRRHGVAFTMQRVSVLSLPNRPGTLARLTERLARKGINIHYLYGTAGGRTDFALVVSARELRRVERIAEEMD